MADELLDIYDEDMNHIGTALRNQVHKDGLWHKVFFCWVVDGDNNLWLQLRGKDKDIYPGLLDISSAGHLSAGETFEDGVREIEEELGLSADFKNLIKLFEGQYQKKLENKKDNEFFMAFLLKTDKSIYDLKPQPEEVDGIFSINVDDMEKLLVGNIESLIIKGLTKNDNNSYTPTDKNISKDDFVPIHDYLKILELIRK